MEYNRLRKQILSHLKKLGYSSKSPSCEIRLYDISETSCRYGVFPVRQLSGDPIFEQTIKLTGGEQLEDIITGIEMSLSEGEMSACSIVRKEKFLRKLTSWVNRAITHLGDEFDETYVDEAVSWSVELSIHENAIHWEAEQVNGNGHRSGVLYDDPKILFDRDARSAIREVKAIAEGDLVPVLKYIDNLDDVLKKQVVQVVKELRQFQEEIDV